MAALMKERDTVQLASGGRTLQLPMKGGSKIYQGALVALDESGFAIPAAKTEGLRCAGRAEETVHNQGGDGAAKILTSRGVFVFGNSAVTADKVTQAQVLKACFIEDDQTVSALSTGSSVAGLVLRVDGAGVAVEVGGAGSLLTPSV